MNLLQERYFEWKLFDRTRKLN